MADAFRPLTLLLGAVCLWALSVLILALAGLGSRFPAATSDGKVPPLPSISLNRSQSRLGPMAEYLEVGERPLMTSNRRPAPQLAVDGDAGAADLDVMLTSVLITPRLQLAILTGNKDGASRRVRVGQTVEGSNWRLLSLEPRRAVIEGPSGQRTLELRVFDGKGGEMPTAAIAPAGNKEAGQGAQSPASVPTTPALPQQPITEPNVNGQLVAQPAATVSQEQQVEAIRRRIEARRAQMRAEAAASSSNDN